MKKSTIILIVLVLVVAGGIALSKKKVVEPMNTEDTSMQDMHADDTAATTPEAKDTTASVDVGVSVGTNVKTFTVNGDNFKFAPSTMTVNRGDTVTIVFKNTGGMHDLKIDEFNVATPKLQGGQEASVTFVADKAGSFEYYCSVGTHRQMGMFGTLTVQ
jgi:plastocyanin